MHETRSMSDESRARRIQRALGCSYSHALMKIRAIKDVEAQWDLVEQIEKDNPTYVVNINKEDCDIIIMRPSKWGNPFIIGQAGNRQEVIEKYEAWLRNGILNRVFPPLHELYGQRLGCMCYPSKCHGDVLARLANELGKQEGWKSQR